MSDTITCLFCQTKNSASADVCTQCGMALSQSTPDSTQYRRNRFKKFFWIVAIFCLVMMFFLPRHFF